MWTQQTQRVTGSAFRISFQPDWQIDNGFFKWPIMARSQILVYRRGGGGGGGQNKDFGDVSSARRVKHYRIGGFFATAYWVPYRPVGFLQARWYVYLTPKKSVVTGLHKAVSYFECYQLWTRQTRQTSARKTCESSSTHAKLYIVQLSNYVKTTISTHRVCKCKNKVIFRDCAIIIRKGGS